MLTKYTDNVNKALAKIYQISDDQMVHFSKAQKQLYRLTQKHPDLGVIDVGTKIDRAHTQLKILSYTVEKTLQPYQGDGKKGSQSQKRPNFLSKAGFQIDLNHIELKPEII